jgi:glycosyltransferase involved in cell wall biosynthesis
MKILIIIQCTNLGGMEHNMLMLIDELSNLNVECEVFSLNPLGDLAALLDKRGISAIGGIYQGWWGMKSFWSTRRQLKNIQADGMIMIGHNLMASLAIGRLWSKHRILAIHYHHRGVMSPWAWRLIYGIASLQFRSVVFVSNYIMQEAIEIAPILRKRAFMVSTPVKVSPTRSPENRLAARQRLGIPLDARVVGNAGWLINRKRWDLFLDVAAQTIRAAPETIFVIAGDGSGRAELERKAAALGIGKNVLWLGWRQNLADFHQAIDILLFNSDWDAQARTPLEAMAHGIPVVASILQGGTKEVILDESMGILLETHDIEKLAQKLVSFILNPELAAQVGDRARQRIMEYGSPQEHANLVMQALGFDLRPAPALASGAP